VVLSPNVLNKGVGIGLTASYFGLACLQTIPHLPGFYHRPMTGRTAACKLRHANMIKTIQKIIDKMNKMERQGQLVGQK